MGARLIDGAQLAKEIREEVASGVRKLQVEHRVTPGLAAILVGDDPASATYVRNKNRACAETGIFAETFPLPKDTSEEGLLSLVQQLNGDTRFHGILIQLPLPRQIDERRILMSPDPQKDVEGLHPVNMGRLVEGHPVFVPCTPAAIQQLLARYGYDPAGKHVVVCGRSNIVGKPVAIFLMQRLSGVSATVTVCDQGSPNLAELTRQADILITAVGRPSTITANMVKEGVVVIDVGINRMPDKTRPQGYRLVGDVDFAGVAEKAEAITPVPGGVGPMTVAMLLVNTLKAANLAAGGDAGERWHQLLSHPSLERQA
ncbi:MAG: bifunctional methylenetetrahydrofolate dehydrogenase/methenyltetrahydrofolate cyclohydrolase FolD [Chloroflexi bacterium]|nr:bifunctional methylenetetrahydrofolate dehydrogenase/methenyltetrahydrofolate cyclohydrolase FolD [Chloroflexota bacterium]